MVYFLANHIYLPPPASKLLSQSSLAIIARVKQGLYPAAGKKILDFAKQF